LTQLNSIIELISNRLGPVLLSSRPRWCLTLSTCAL